MKKFTRSDLGEHPPAYDAVIKEMEAEEDLPTYNEAVEEHIERQSKEVEN